MPQTHDTDGKDASPKPAAGASDSGATHANVSGEASPRLPHEHDESSDSGTRPPDPHIEQAAKDAQSGKQQTDKGETTDAVYGEHLRGDHAKRE